MAKEPAGFHRKEDLRHTTGKGRFLADITLPGMLHCSFVRSPYPRAKIVKVDLEKAKTSSGVVAVFAAADLLSRVKPVKIVVSTPRLAITCKPLDLPPLVLDRVSCVGQPVAIVVAADKYLADDAADLVDVEYEPLEPITSVEQALRPGSGLVYEDWGSNEYFDGSVGVGDVSAAFNASDRVFKETLKVHRHTGVPLETRGCVADFDGASLTFYSSTQSVFSFRDILAEAAGLPKENVNVVAPDVGGGFGVKSNIYPEDLAVMGASIILRRPTKWVETRKENLLSATHARELVNTIEVGVMNDGTITAVRCNQVADMGVATAHPYGGVISSILAAKLVLGSYRIANYFCNLKGAATNKAAFGAYRGFGLPEATFFMERMMDIIAKELKIDRAELRLKNMIDKDELPYQTASLEVYDAGDFKGTLNRALEVADYRGYVRSKSRSSGKRLKGIGIAVNVESTSPAVPTEDLATVSVGGDGWTRVNCAVSSIGTSLETLAARVVADELGLDFDSVKVTVGDTRRSLHHLGVFGSRSTIVLTVSLKDACRRLRETALELASKRLGVPPEELRLDKGKVHGKGGKASVSLRELARKAEGGKLEASGKYSPPKLVNKAGRELPYTGSFTNAAHVATVEVDTETGKVDVTKYVAVHDAGKILIPQVVEGQVVGGVAQGVGGALYEEILYSQEGQLLTSTLMDYAMPSATEMPPVVVEHIETLTELLPVPFKGVGESGVIGGCAAISNAVHDALSSFDVRIDDLPLTPEKVLSAIRGRAQKQRDSS